MTSRIAHRTSRRSGVALAAAAAAVLVVAACSSSAGGSKDAALSIAVADESAFISLPLPLAQSLGFYKKNGLNVSLDSVQGGAQAAQAMVGGSADIAEIAMDTSIQLDSQKPDYVAFGALTRYYTGMLVAAPGNTSITSVKNLAGQTIGVTAPGSSSQRFVQYLMTKDGVNDSTARFVGIGAGATSIAALEHHKVAVAFLLEPAYTLLQKQNPGKPIPVLADTRTAAGDTQVFGAPDFPSTVLTAKTSWLDSHASTARKLMKAIAQTLQWISTHTAAQVAAKMPTSFYGGDESSYVKALTGLMTSFSPTGEVPADGVQSVYRVLTQFVPSVKQSGITATSTYTNKYLSAS